MGAPYRTPPFPRPGSQPPDPYLVAWARYQDRRWLKVVLFFTWPFVAWMVVAMLRPRNDDGGLFIFLAVAVGALGVMSWLGTFTCPRCSGRMYVRQSPHPGSRDGCTHCGIAVGTPKFDR